MSIHKIYSEQQTPQNCIILAASGGLRKSYREPEILYEINKNKVIDIHVENIKKSNPYTKITIVVGFNSTKAINYIQSKHEDISIIENVDYKNTGPVDSLRLAINSVDKKNTFFFYGNRIYSKELFDIPSAKKILLLQGNTTKKSYNCGMVVDKKNVVKNLAYGLDIEWGESAFFPGSKIPVIKSILNNKRKKYKDMVDFLNILASEQIVSTYRPNKIKIRDSVR